MPVIDSYDVTNGNLAYSVSAGNDFGAGQSFSTGAAPITVNSVTFGLSKNGSPTGSGYAKIYAITGTHGSTAIPTGTALMTSNALDVSTLTGSRAAVVLTFSGTRPNLSASTNYAVAFEYAGGDASNYVNVYVDTTSSSHAGNSFEGYSSAWHNNATWDTVFAVVGDPVTAYTLTVNDSSHGLTSDDTYVQHNLPVTGATSAIYGGWGSFFAGASYTGAGSNVFSSFVLEVADTSHALTSENVSLTSKQTLIVNDTSHDITSENSIVALAMSVISHDSEIGLSSENVLLVPDWRLIVDDSNHEITSELGVVLISLKPGTIETGGLTPIYEGTPGEVTLGDGPEPGIYTPKAITPREWEETVAPTVGSWNNP